VVFRTREESNTLGYYYTADFTFIIPQATETAIALDIDTLIAQMNNAQYFKNHLYTRDVFSKQNATGETLLARIFDYCDFEMSEITTTAYGSTDGEADGEAEGSAKGEITTTYHGYVSAKWGTYAEAIILFLASHGAGVDMTCIGEDNERWCYAAEVNAGNANWDTVQSVPGRELKTLKDAQETLTKIRELVTDPSQRIDSANYLYERLEELLTTVPATVPASAPAA
jgi:hypothetical protein